jgi:hypothetical protein
VAAQVFKCAQRLGSQVQPNPVPIEQLDAIGVKDARADGEARDRSSPVVGGVTIVPTDALVASGPPSLKGVQRALSSAFRPAIGPPCGARARQRLWWRCGIDDKEPTMNLHSLRVLGLVMAAGVLSAAPARAADGDATFNGMIEQFRQRAPSEQWVNPYMASGTGRSVETRSADEILTATLRVYTRDVLDRGYWVNHWVDGAPGYDAGNPLLAVAPGTGVKTAS